MLKKLNLKLIYDLVILVLALISVILVFFDMFSVLSLEDKPYKQIDLIILLLFWTDYICRFLISKSKVTFFKENIADFIAIIPFNSIFSFFRISRVFRIAKVTRLSKLTKTTRLVRAFAFIGILRKRLKKFLRTNGFIYVIYCNLSLILLSSIIMSFAEKQSFYDALWWSIVTCTTVGYGDISPSTATGRIVAVILMLFGIGFIGMLTSTITTYFTKETYKDEEVNYKKLLNDISNLSKDEQENLKEYINNIN